MCGGFIFTTSKGTVPTNESLNRTINVIVNAYNKKETIKAEEEGRKATLMPYYTIHSTRHTFATTAYRKKCVDLAFLPHWGIAVRKQQRRFIPILIWIF